MLFGLLELQEMYVQICKKSVPSGTLWKSPDFVLQAIQPQWDSRLFDVRKSELDLRLRL